MAFLDRWFVRFSRFGTTHLVRCQEGVMACGPCCCMMTCCRVNKYITIKEGAGVEAEIYQKFDAVAGSPLGTYTGITGTNPNWVAAVLNGLGIGQWQASNVADTGVGDAVIQAASFFQLTTMPIIVGVTFPGSLHFVMIDAVFNLLGTRYAIVNDPWDADLHVTKITTGARITYHPKRTWSFDLWGTRRDMGAGVAGYFNGDIVSCTGMDVRARLGKVFLSANPM